MSSTLMRSCIGAAALFALVAAPLDAQIGGLRRRAQQAAEKALNGPDQQATGITYNESVLEMTPEVVDRFARALTAEEAERSEVARIAAAVRTPEAYQTCLTDVVMSERGQALMHDMTAKGEARISNPGDKAAADAYLAAQKTVMDYNRERCGPDPDTFQSSELPALQARPAKVGMEAGGFNPTQYAILKERVVPLCSMARPDADGEVRIPGDGKNIFWVYSEIEVKTITPRCAELVKLMGSTK